MTLAEKLLRDFTLFRGLGQRDVMRAARMATPRELGRDEVYVRAGTKLSGIGCLITGSLKLCLDRARIKQVFAIVDAGESFCEASAVRRVAAPFDIVALEKSLVLTVPLTAIERLIKSNHAFSTSLISILADRTLAAVRDLKAENLDGRKRLALYLTSLPQHLGVGAWHVQLPVNKGVVAQRLGMKKETLSRMFRRLVDDGLIAVQGRHVVLLDRDRLLNSWQQVIQGVPQAK